MGFDALWGAMVHRTEIDLATLEGPKAAFDHPKTLIGQGGVLDTHGANRQTEARFTLSRLERQASSGLRRSGTVPVVGYRPGDFGQVLEVDRLGRVQLQKDYQGCQA